MPNGRSQRSGKSEVGGSAFIPVWIIATRLDLPWNPRRSSLREALGVFAGAGRDRQADEILLRFSFPQHAHLFEMFPQSFQAQALDVCGVFFYFFFFPSPRADHNKPGLLQVFGGMKQTLAADSCDFTSSGELSSSWNKRDDILPRVPSASLRFEL